MGILERDGDVVAKVISNTSRETLHGEIKNHVESGSEVFTDGYKYYKGIDAEYVHEL